MQEVFEKIMQKLENASWWTDVTYDEDGYSDDDRDEVITLDEAIGIVDQVAQEYNNGWILCSERLPEKPANYLVCSKGVVWMANYFNYTWWGVEKKIRWQDVEAWQPLPAPYQKGE